MTRCRPGLSGSYPDLIGPVRDKLEKTGRPYIIENVAAARAQLRNPMTLCGEMFGRPVYRHRLFESCRLELTAPTATAAQAALAGERVNRECGWRHPVPAAKAGHWKPGYYVSVSGHERREPVRQAMEIDWMTRREDVAEAIPPYFTKHIGRQVMAQL